MVHLEVTNQPEALGGRTLTHRLNCQACTFNLLNRELAVYDDFIQWANKTAGYYITDVVEITMFDDHKEVKR